MDVTTLFSGMILGSIGMGYFVYGKRQQKGVALLSGLILCGVPYFISNVYLLIISGIVLMACPFIIKY
ncbi:MAG: hypothetical protein OEU26_02260 [Candidatus Tectomicrobia bacterium]|nr:hypothetical protein [Candidatus Tectomicrobia bacterium]